MHLPVHISHGRGSSHSNTMPAITASVHTSTTIPMNITPTLCKVLSAKWCRKRRIEHLEMLSANTKSIVEMKTFICTCSRSTELRRHCRFPRPESTAVEMITVAPMPHREAPTTLISSNSGRCCSRCDRHRLMSRIAVHSALILKSVSTGQCNVQLTYK